MTNKDFLDDFFNDIDDETINNEPEQPKKTPSKEVSEIEKELDNFDDDIKYDDDNDDWLSSFGNDENDNANQKRVMDELFDDDITDEEDNNQEDDTDTQEDFDDEYSDDSENEQNWNWEDEEVIELSEDEAEDFDDFDDDEDEDDNDDELDKLEKEIEEKRLQEEIEKEEKSKDIETVEWLTNWYINLKEEEYQYWAINKVPIRPMKEKKLPDPSSYFSSKVSLNKKIVMTDWRAYKSLEKLFNILSKDEVTMFSKKLVESDTYKNVKLEHFKATKIKMWKFDYWCFIDCSSLSYKDPKEIPLDEAAEYLVDVLYTDDELIDEKGNKINIKKGSAFFRRWRFFALLDKTLVDSHWYDIVTTLVDNWDYANVILWYDLLNNKLVFEKYPNLMHYQMIGASKSGKSETMKGIMLQYLAKNNTELMVVEKANDFNLVFQKAKKMIYKATVDELQFPDLISFFSYLSINFSLRRKIMGKFWNLEDYNKLREKEGKQKLWYMLIVIDEFFVLRWNLKAAWYEDFFLQQLASVASKARSYWIYLMIATQSPNTDGIPSNLQNNLQIKFTGKTQQASNIKYFKNDVDARPIAAKQVIYQGDFLLSADCTEETIVRGYFDVYDSLQKLIDNNYILWRNEEEQEEIEIAWWPGNFSIDYLSRKNLELIEKTWCKLVTTTRFARYWISQKEIDRIPWITKIAIIVLINFILDWIEKTSSTLRESNVTPIPFNIDNAIAIENNKIENASLAFIFVLIDSLYKNYLQDGIKTIKFSKSDMKWLNDDWATEALETFLANIVETAIYYIKEMLTNMKVDR